MKIVSNEKLIKRNHKIGQFATIASLVILVAGTILAFSNNTGYITYAFAAVIFGFLLSQVGLYYGNRWGRSPRPDEIISSSLKGLSDKYTLYHYAAPVSHLLVGPAGVVCILPYAQGGTITYDSAKKRWKQKGGNFYLKIFGQESLGRPDLEVRYNIEDMTRFLQKQSALPETPQPTAVLLFTNSKAALEAPDAPYPTTSPDKIKDVIRRLAKESPLSQETVDLLTGLLPQ